MQISFRSWMYLVYYLIRTNYKASRREGAAWNKTVKGETNKQLVNWICLIWIDRLINRLIFPASVHFQLAVRHTPEKTNVCPRVFVFVCTICPIWPQVHVCDELVLSMTHTRSHTYTQLSTHASASAHKGPLCYRHGVCLEWWLRQVLCLCVTVNHMQ